MPPQVSDEHGADLLLSRAGYLGAAYSIAPFSTRQNERPLSDDKLSGRFNLVPGTRIELVQPKAEGF